MSEKKLIIVKLDDESYPLMKDYVVDDTNHTSTAPPPSTSSTTKIPQPDWVKPKSTKTSKSSIRFDELSFAM